MDGNGIELAAFASIEPTHVGEVPQLRTVFILDDDPDASELMALAVAGPRRSVRAFNDAGRALAALAVEHADLLITDLAMPWMDGEQVLRQVQRSSPGTQIIVVSGFDAGRKLADRERVKFLPKPVDANQLRRIIEELVEPDLTPSAPPGVR